MDAASGRKLDAAGALDQTRTHDATDVFALDRGSTSRAEISLKLSSSGGLLPHLTGEIRDLVMIRLREVALLVTVGWVLVLVVCLTGIDGLFGLKQLGIAPALVLSVCTTVFVACWLALHSRIHFSLAWLRAFEGVFLWGSVLCAAWLRFAAVSFALAQSPSNSFMVLYASALSSLFWMSVVVIYGIFAPNTWPRLALMTSAVIAVLVVLDIVIWFAGPPIDLNLLIANLLVTAMAIFLGVGIALYGSFKLGAAHEEAVAARQQLRELGRYQLTRPIGSGAMGEVYLAQHTLLRRPCAVKLIRPSGPDGEKQIARFAREVQATAALTHPNTVEIYDYGRTEDGTFYYAMEFLPGQTLDQLVERFGPLSSGRVIHLLRQVCGALHEAHVARLIHRDIKPANIVVCSRGGIFDVVKLLDFGLVREIAPATDSGKLTQIGAVAGTPEYMSPEQAQGFTELNVQSDIYSLGAVAYYLLTGRPPFQKQTSLQLLIAHVHEAIIPPREICPTVDLDLEAVVLKCLEKNRDRRFSKVAEMDVALSRCSSSSSWSQEDAAQWWSEHADDQPSADSPQ